MMSKRKVSVNNNHDIKTRLFEAIRLQDTSCVQDLLVNQFNSTRQDREPILYGFCQAVQQGSIDMVQVFLQHGGISVDEPDPMFGESPLMQAVRYQYHHLVDFLIQHGAGVNFKSSFEQSTCLHAAVSSRSEVDNPFDILKKVVQLPGVKLDEYNSSGKTPLVVAVQHSKWKAIDILLAAGADVNKKYLQGNDNRGIPLPFLCFGYFNPHVDMHNSTMCLQALLNVTKKPDIQWQGQSLLMLAIQANYILAVKYLIAINCDLDLGGGESKFDFGEGVYITPILEAYARCNSRVVHLLIEAGCRFHSLSVYLDPLYHGNIQNKDESLKCWIMENLISPRRLKDICRIKIRACLGNFPSDKIDKLHIPNIIKDFILLNDVLA